MLQSVKLEHANIRNDVRTIDRYIDTENAPSFTASVGLAQARPNYANNKVTWIPIARLAPTRVDFSDGGYFGALPDLQLSIPKFR